MFGMILLILGEDQDIIEIHQNEFIGIGVEDEIHHPREHRRSIDKAERHDSIFIRTWEYLLHECESDDNPYEGQASRIL